MQQLSRVCIVADHDQRQIEYVCMYPECTQSRFLCSKCTIIGNHKHQLQDQSHIFEKKELQLFIKEKLFKRQTRLDHKINNGAQLQINPFKQIMQEMHHILQNIRNMIDKLQQCLDPKASVQLLNEQLLNLNNNGYNQFDDTQLNILINFDKQIDDIYTQISDQSKNIIQNLIRIQQSCYSQKLYNCGIWDKKIKDAKRNLITQDQTTGDFQILSSAISNDYKYIVSGGTDQQLKIWNYNNNKLIKQIELANWITSIRITDDSKLVYVAQVQYLIQFEINNQFKETYKQIIHTMAISNIRCLTNTIILTSSVDKTIIKTDITNKQQLLKINAHNDEIDGLDYDYTRNIIASSSYDKSIKLWNATNGQLVLEKQDAHNNQCRFIQQVLFIIKKNQLISLDNSCNLIIWNVNYENKQLEQLQKIFEPNGIYNISLVIDQQYITLVCLKYMKIYSIRGDFIKQFNHDVKEFIMTNLIQPQSMKAFIIEGQQTLKICKFDIN